MMRFCLGIRQCSSTANENRASTVDGIDGFLHDLRDYVDAEITGDVLMTKMSGQAPSAAADIDPKCARRAPLASRSGRSNREHREAKTPV
jgi:hypothetical protein